MKKLIIAGGTGFLGSILIDYFKNQFDEIVLLSRKQNNLTQKIKTVIWDAKTVGPWTQELEGADVLINMTGRSVDCRYTPKNKELILNSRVESTTLLGKVIAQLENPPKIWLNSSTATIYKHSLHVKMDEDSGELGNGFSVHVAKAWETAFFSSKTPRTRKVALRTSIVLGKNGGALQPMKTITKLGLGGKQGNGKQKFSWIHEIDFARAIEFIIDDTTIHGVVNLASEYPSDNNRLMNILRSELHMPFGISAPKFMLEIGAFIIQTETELILKSRYVIPKRLIQHGFSFQFNKLDIALKNLLK